MRTAMRNFTRQDWLRTRFVSGAILLFGFTALSGFALAQTSSSDNAAHFSYDSQGPARPYLPSKVLGHGGFWVRGTELFKCGKARDILRVCSFIFGQRLFDHMSGVMAWVDR
jgi:hypothetical protein